MSDKPTKPKRQPIIRSIFDDPWIMVIGAIGWALLVGLLIAGAAGP